MDVCTAAKRKNLNVEPREHHKKLDVCKSRPAYREGRNPTAVKVYTVNDESKHLLIFGVPSINIKKDLQDQLCEFGAVKSLELVPNYPGVEQFTQVYHACYSHFIASRVAKKRLDGLSFFGSELHVCYAPELETVEETRQKLIDRRKNVKYQLNVKKPHGTMLQEKVAQFFNYDN